MSTLEEKCLIHDWADQGPRRAQWPSKPGNKL